jgi:trehalose 6-phosphate synthase/phosphatase
MGRGQNKLIIASMRLPVSVSKLDGKLHYSQSTGGLATGVSTISRSRHSIWVGWPGISSSQLTAKDKSDIIKELQKHGCYPVFLGDKEVEEFYSGYCNATIWPLFHYFSGMAEYNSTYWKSYLRVNQQFLKTIANFSTNDSQIWVHDYQLMPLPGLIRNRFHKAQIGFFLHTPFPSYKIFRLIPERKEILEGLLGANLIGFHTYDYVRHFLSSAKRITGTDSHLGVIQTETHSVLADAFPIGIDYDKFHKSSRTRPVKSHIKSFDINRRKMKIILAVDRADYTKGIPARLDAFDQFLRQHPERHGNVIMVLLAAPSREDVEAYKDLRDEIEQKVSRINGEFSTVGWTPITYFHKSLPLTEVSALYAIADVMLVTPLRDGMNLVAKEYVAARRDQNGVLILSEMAGVASELTEAIQVNPNDTTQVAKAIEQALSMPAREEKQRMKAMQDRISSYTITKWAQDFITELERTSQKATPSSKQVGKHETKQLVRNYQQATSRLILLDYDGTLKQFVASPDKALARPSAKVKRVIRTLTDDPRNKVVIVSGRPKTTLESFFQNKGLGLVAEHGGWIFDAGSWVKSSITSPKWKKSLKPIMEQFTARTPGAVFEEKDFSLVWHYRQVSPDLAYVRKEELKMELRSLLDESDVEVFEGEKIVEVKPRTMHKGAIVTELVSREHWDFILCIGDDYTDEDMFRALPERAYTLHVGDDDTDARYLMHNVDDVIALLKSFKTSKS